MKKDNDVTGWSDLEVSDRFLKTRQVMKILACSRDYLARLRMEGKLVPMERGKTHHVYSLQEVERYMRREKERARQEMVDSGDGLTVGSGNLKSSGLAAG